ncbi:MAG: type II secretion system minor pseudopilin GspH [Halofilum sp. (in: g-proteobacteria)]|nr:type II secretion system minor pseudopilin GspH [Halofilum sp. (in: g-proteobacteria)]
MSHRTGIRCAGFTYIELLVALFLIGLFVSLALLSLPAQSPADRLQREAERLYVRMDLAREEAVLQARTLGLRIDEKGYRFLHLHSDRWQALADDRLLPAHELPDSVQLSLDLEGIEVSLDNEEDENDTEDERPPPQIYFLAGGEIVPPFQLRLRGEDTGAEFIIEPGDEKWLTLVEAGE